jgi:hypothetical protein
MFIRMVSALCAAMIFISTAQADENSVRRGFQARFPDMKIESVTRMPFPGLYEVGLLTK